MWMHFVRVNTEKIQHVDLSDTAGRIVRIHLGNLSQVVMVPFVPITKLFLYIVYTKQYGVAFRDHFATTVTVHHVL